MFLPAVLSCCTHFATVETSLFWWSLWWKAQLATITILRPSKTSDAPCCHWQQNLRILDGKCGYYVIRTARWNFPWPLWLPFNPVQFSVRSRTQIAGSYFQHRKIQTMYTLGIKYWSYESKRTLHGQRTYKLSHICRSFKKLRGSIAGLLLSN